MLQGASLFGKFSINNVGKVLYLVLEDPPRRIKARFEMFSLQDAYRRQGVHTIPPRRHSPAMSL